MREHLASIFVVALLAATFATLPQVDYAEANVFFYLQHLTPLYYMTLIVSIAMAIYWRRSYLGLLSAIVLSLLILLTPSMMFVQPWFPDTYPFVSEAVYVMRNGHIGDFHYLSVSPSLGLLFGPFLVLTGISPFMLIKIYPGIIAVILTVLLYLIAKKIKIGKGSPVIAALLFVSIAWPNELHLCRQSFSLIFYIASWFLLLRLTFHGPDRRILALLVSQIILQVLSHPATPLFFIANLSTILILDYVLAGLRRKEFKSRPVILPTLLTSSFLWILWNSFTPTGAIRNLESIAGNLITSLFTTPTEVPGVARIFVGYTPIYRAIIDSRLVLTAAIFSSAVLFPLLMYRYLRDRNALVMLMGWVMSNMASSVLLLYAGLPYFARPALFAFMAWGPLGAIVYDILAKKRKSGIQRKIKSVAAGAFLVGFIIVPSLLMPLIKYSPLPFLYTTGRELTSKSFLNLHWSGNTEVIYFDAVYIANTYSWLFYGSNTSIRSVEIYSIYSPNEGLDPNIVNRSALWVTYKPVTRDAFWNYNPSYLQVVENVTQLLPKTTHNKVYDSGWPECILLPRNGSP
jgi:hypothetical protein